MEFTPAKHNEKDLCWDHLVDLYEVINSLWCIIGDLSELTNANEKKRGQVYPNSKFQRVSAFLTWINTESVPVNGSIFTWKKRIHTHLIYERLDKPIVCKEGMNIYPDSVVTYGNFSCSDHCPSFYHQRS